MAQDHFYLVKMSNTAKIIGIVGLILLSVFVLVAARNYLSGGNNINNNIINNENANNDNEQVVQLTMKNSNYYPNIINLKYNIPAKIVVDTNTVRGCLRSIVIPDFNVRKSITPNDNVISFTPNKRGTFRFSCSMGMGFGKIIVN